MGVLENIYLSRITSASQLSKRQRARLAWDVRLAQALDHNGLLKAPACPPPPPLERVLPGAYTCTFSLPACDAHPVVRMRRLGWVFAAVLVLALLGALALIPHGKGWAHVDGFVLRYPLLYPGYANITYYHSIPGPPRELGDRVRAWAQQHAGAVPDGWQGELAYTSNFVWQNTDPWVKAQQHLPLVYAGVQEVTLVNGDQQLLDSLLEATRGIAHVCAPEVVEAGWFYNRRQAQLYARQERLVIEGQARAFPQDFSPEDAQVLGASCGGLLPGQPMAYAYFDAELERRCRLGTVNRLERIDQTTVKIDVLAREPLFSDLELPRPYGLGIALSNLPEGIDPAGLIYRQASERAANKEGEFREFKGWGIVIPLYGTGRFEGALAGTLPAVLSSEERAQGEARYTQLRERFDAWGREHEAQIAATNYRCAAMASPEFIMLRKHANADPQNLKDYEQIRLAFTAELRVDDPALRDSLLASLSDAAPVHPPLLWELYPIKEPLAQLTEPARAQSVK